MTAVAEQYYNNVHNIIRACPRRVVTGCVLPLFTAFVVMIYVYVSGGRWTGGIACVPYAVCLIALLLATAVASGYGQRCVSMAEHFVDSAKSIADEILMPRLDRLVLGLMGKNADGSTVDNNGGSSASDTDDPSVIITPDRFLHDVKGDANIAAAIVQEYAQISYMMCRIAESYPEAYKKLFS